MPSPLAGSIIDFALGLVLASTDQESSNRVSLEGLTLGSRKDGTLEIGIRRLTAASVRAASGPLMLEVEQLAFQEIAALVRVEEGRPRLCALEAASAGLSGVKVQAPVPFFSRRRTTNLHVWHALRAAPASATSTAGQAPRSAWQLGPLAAADGVVRAEIVDAHLLFDADVTVRIRQGAVDFNDATVEHVGPDSRMGVSRLGIYVDAPNGRSYLYQFPSAPVAGVEYERRGAMLGPWVTDRGRLRLQAFGEALLRQSRGAKGLGFTEQARLLLDRTAVWGDVRLGDGNLVVPGAQADMAGHSEGRNVVRLRSEAVGRGLTVEMASLLLRNAVLGSRDVRIDCGEIAGALKLRLFVQAAQLRLAFDLAEMKISGLRLQLHRPERG